MAQNNDSKKGFASMDEEKQREISRKGGEASHGGGRQSGSSDGRSSGGQKGGSR